MCGYAKDTLGRSATPDGALRAARRRPPWRATGGNRTSRSTLRGASWTTARSIRAEPLALVRAFSGKARRLLFETLPEFATPEASTRSGKRSRGSWKWRWASNRRTRTFSAGSVHKNAPPSEYSDAGDRVRRLGPAAQGLPLAETALPHGAGVGARRARLHAEASGRFDALSVNPVHIQNGTVVEWLYRRDRYRPPWLWSSSRRCAAERPTRGPLGSSRSPPRGGLPRGPHNCGKCDARVLEAIETASLRQDFTVLDSLECDCRADWERFGRIEPLGVEA